MRTVNVIEGIYFAALEKKAPGERLAYLDEACKGDEVLRRLVDRMLESAPKVGNFLEPVAPGLPTTTDSPSAERPGLVIGPYKLLHEIGEGGMGTVWLAEQEQPVKRKVALKLIKPGMDSKQVLARFEAERQALALMDHPNIAKVLDAGATESGRPYFVMELVKGVPITEFCDQNQLTPRERLELFVPVCHAIQHAHQKGVIHRDIKPSNVLVALYDGRPVPKVIDFGVAKATAEPLTDKSLFTRHGQVVGTFEYMSPEQATLDQLDIDTRSDVYSLGVLLYELLTGTTPLEKDRLRQAGFAEMLRLIREEEPPAPSTRLSNSAGLLATAAAYRKSDSQKLPRIVRGELDWIVMKALDKERSRRFETANGLAMDVERYLKDEPVTACPPTLGYRLRKFGRKHRSLLATAAGFAALLLLGVAVSTWQAVRATQAVGVANDNAKVALQNEQEADRLRKVAQEKGIAVGNLNDQLRHTLYISHMIEARHAWEAGGVERARELLDLHRPQPGESDLRHFEWYYLYRLSHSEPLTLKGHTEDIVRVAYSPDGRRLASASCGGESINPDGSGPGRAVPGRVKVWDAPTGKELFTLKDTAVFNSVAFSPDGKYLATSSTSFGFPGDANQPRVVPGAVKIWDAQTGEELRTVSTDGRAGAIVFSPDGERLAACIPGSPVGDGQVRVWEVKTGKELITFKGHTGQVSTVAFTPDGKRLASVATTRGGRRGQPPASSMEVKVWDAQTGEELSTLKKDTEHRRRLTFSPDGKRLAGSDSNSVKVWDAETGQELFTLRAPGGGVSSLAFSSDGRRLAGAAYYDSSVKVWDAQNGQELFTVQGHTAGILDAAFSPDGQRMASGSADNTVKVWDAQLWEGPLHLRKLQGRLHPLTFSPDGQRLADASQDNTVKVLNTRTGEAFFTLQGDTRKVTSMAFSPDGKWLAIARGDGGAGEVQVYDAQTGQALCTLKGLTGGVGQLVFSPDGKQLATVTGGRKVPGQVKVWDARTGKELLTLKETAAFNSVVFSPDGKHLATSGGDRNAGTLFQPQWVPGVVKVWEVETGEVLLTLKGASWVVFSPDGKRLAGSNNVDVKVWDARTGEELYTLKRSGVAKFSPDGKRLATCHLSDHTVKLWDAETGKELHTLKGHTLALHGGVTDLDFSPDGKRLATSAADNTVKVWDTQTGQETLTLRGTVDYVWGVAFSLDGHRLMSGEYADGTVAVWDATPLPEKP